MVNKLVAAIVLLLLATTVLYAAFPSSGNYGGAGVAGNFYWAANGNDGNNCKSPATACQTIAHFNSFSFPANPTVNFRGGDTFSGGLTNFVANMTITSYGVGQPTFSTGNSTACMTVTNIGGVTINNVVCQGGGNTTNTTNGIYFQNTGAGAISNSTITNSTVTAYGLNCIYFFNSNNPGGGFNTVNVNNNTLHDCTGNSSGTFPFSCASIGYGVIGDNSIPNSNVTINSNTVFNCTGTAAYTTNWSGGGLSVSNINNLTMLHNLVHDTGALNGHSGSGPVGLQTFNDSSTLIAFNEVYHIRGGSVNADGEAFDISNSNNEVFEYNYGHDSSFADILLGTFVGPNGNSNVTIRFNITEQGSQGELSIHSSCGANGCTGWQIYNNTFVGGGIQIGPNSSGNPFSVNFSNNILIGTNGTSSITANFGNGVGFGGTYVITGNDYSNSAISVIVLGVTYNTLATFQAACSSPNTVFEKTGGCVTAVGTTANPNLTGTVGSGGNCAAVFTTPCPNAYTLSSASPAGKGNGLNLNSLYSFTVGTQDIYGNAVTNTTLPIGAAANK